MLRYAGRPKQEYDADRLALSAVLRKAARAAAKRHSPIGDLPPKSPYSPDPACRRGLDPGTEPKAQAGEP